jgi:hypothetical protein
MPTLEPEHLALGEQSLKVADKTVCLDLPHYMLPLMKYSYVWQMNTVQ